MLRPYISYGAEMYKIMCEYLNFLSFHFNIKKIKSKQTSRAQQFNTQVE